MKQPIFALVDCDNFFVSCERVFRPDLWGKPVVVLSNNDGCLVARSNEVKALGIPMAAPYFKHKEVLERHHTTVFSANFALYGDFSARVVGMLEAAASQVEVYSVDESFLEVSDLPVNDYAQWASELRGRIYTSLGIPVSIGIAPTKTLAKAAAEWAKKHPEVQGVYSLVGEKAQEKREALLRAMPIKDVWGVGWRTAPKLHERGVASAYDLSLVSDAWAQQQLTVRGLNTVKELRGEPCYMIEAEAKPQQTLAVTRTFAKRLRTYHLIEGHVASYAARAAQKLRRYGQVAGAMVIFIAGDRHHDRQNYRRVSTVVQLEQPSNDTGRLIEAALKGLELLYDPEFTYRRAGVVLLDLVPAEAVQLSWLAKDSPGQLDRRADLMRSIDAINLKYHTRLIRQAIEPPGSLRMVTKKSPDYTTSWHALPKVQ